MSTGKNEKTKTPMPACKMREMLNISRPQELRLRKDNLLKAHKLGGKVFYFLEDIVSELEKRPAA